MTSPQRLRGAIVGYGFISSKGHMPAYLERSKTKNDVEIVAVCDVVPARLEIAKKDWPGVRTYTDFSELLFKEKGNLDFIDISTPAAMHASMIMASLEEGLHVLCEKPLVTKLEDATRVLSRAREVGKTLFPCHNYKHAPVVKAINEIIASGKIGKVKSITLNTFRNTHAKGVPEWKTDWRRYKEFSGGGIAMDHGSHSLYLMFDWLGSHPTSVSAVMKNFDSAKYDTEDYFNAVLKFPTGMASLHLNWTAGVRKVIYTLQGERGAITVDDDDLQLATMRSQKGKSANYLDIDWDTERYSLKSHWMDSSHVTWFDSLFTDFQKAIDQKEFVGREIKDAWLCIQAITKSYESADNGSREISLKNEI